MQRLVPPLTFLAIIFQHYRLFYIAGYEATLGLFMGISLVFLLIAKLNVLQVGAAWICLLAASSLSALTSPETVPNDYIKTLTLFVLATFIVASAFGKLRFHSVRSIGFARSLLCALVAIVLISIGQVLLGTIGSDLLFNPFGTNQYLHEYRPNIGLVQFPRAHGFFLEPSYNAFVIGSVAAALLCLQRYTKTTVALAVFGLVACQSATGLLLLVLFLAFVATRSRPTIAIASAALILGVVLYAGDYLWIRLLSFNTEGSSAYYRVFAPVEVLMDVLAHSPLGMPLGSVEQVMSRYGLQMAGVQASSLDNGFYVIIFYFGWLGVLFLAVMLLCTLAATRNHVAHSFAWMAPTWLFSSLFFSGGIMAPEFAIMTFIVIASYSSNPKFELRKSEASLATQHHNRDVSRSGRRSTHHQISRPTTRWHAS